MKLVTLGVMSLINVILIIGAMWVIGTWSLTGWVMGAVALGAVALGTVIGTVIFGVLWPHRHQVAADDEEADQ